MPEWVWYALWLVAISSPVWLLWLWLLTADAAFDGCGATTDTAAPEKAASQLATPTRA
jgi:hypothetical protein